MKLFIFLAVVACSNAAKLDRTYLPPNAQTSGGSGSFLQPPQNYQDNARYNSAGNYAQANQDFGQSGNYQQNRNVIQKENDFSQNGNSYYQNSFSGNGNSFSQNGNSFSNDEYSQNDFVERPRAAIDRNAAILRFENQNDGESYAFGYETENGIIAEETGEATNGVEAQGGYSYTGDDGQVYTVRYTAGVNGFIPEGDHLPTPPPIPEEILKALEQNARDETNGVYDDGSYNAEKYGDSDSNDNNNYYQNGNTGDNFNNNYNANNNYNGNNNYDGNSNSDNNNYQNDNTNGNNYNGNFNIEQIEGDEDSVVTNNALLRSADRKIHNEDSQSRNLGIDQEVNKAYLPPFAQQTYSNQPSQYNQGGTNGRNAYLPPFERNEQINRRKSNQGTNVSRSQRINGNTEVNKAYLPPFEGQQRSSYNGHDQTSKGAAITKAYLPPTNQRSQNFDRGQSRYNARSGYQY